MTMKRADLSKFVRCQCCACHDEYFLHQAVNSIIDSGLCLSCEAEVAELERLYGARAAQ